ncbi:MBL fold metallo-hydrolase [Rhodobacteraceae bacterium]|nr:MBL fold metallo-hydrolase [Paracoccaceae bacterium]
MARLTAISGFGAKSAAIFLLELHGRRVLFDLGCALEAGPRPDLSAIGVVDAVLLSHAHIDHAGGLDRLDEVGAPLVYMTQRTAMALPHAISETQIRRLPERGHAQVAGLDLHVGRAGHAPGGIWFHLPTPAGGFVYSGDFSLESRSLPFDPFPAAASMVVDASYGDRDDLLATQATRIALAAAQGAVLPCPDAGRGPDMVMELRAQGLDVHACARIVAECATIMPARDLPPVVDMHTAHPRHVIVATGPNADHGLCAQLHTREGFRFIFSSHVPETSPAAAMIATGRAKWMGWNVHPRARDLIALLDLPELRQIMPAFVDPATAPTLCRTLGPKCITTPVMAV